MRSWSKWSQSRYYVDGLVIVQWYRAYCKQGHRVSTELVNYVWRWRQNTHGMMTVLPCELVYSFCFHFNHPQLITISLHFVLVSFWLLFLSIDSYRFQIWKKTYHYFAFDQILAAPKSTKNWSDSDFSTPNPEPYVLFTESESEFRKVYPKFKWWFFREA
jgi:hypothetical protein